MRAVAHRLDYGLGLDTSDAALWQHSRQPNDCHPMTTANLAVFITYVGGPLHGAQKLVDAPPDQYWEPLPGGAAILYSVRWRSEASATQPFATYAPAGMSAHAYRELLDTVDINPPAASDRAVVSAPSSERKQRTG